MQHFALTVGDGQGSLHLESQADHHAFQSVHAAAFGLGNFFQAPLNLPGSLLLFHYIDRCPYHFCTQVRLACQDDRPPACVAAVLFTWLVHQNAGACFAQGAHNLDGLGMRTAM